MDPCRVVLHISLLVFLLLSFVEEGLGIRCYMCNSNILPNCDNIKEVPDTEKSRYEVDCNKMPGNQTYTLCRVIEQDVDGDKSIVRQCATAGKTDECQSRTGTKKIKMKYCHCAKDLCNTATRHSIHTVLSLLSTILSFYFMLK